MSFALLEATHYSVRTLPTAITVNRGFIKAPFHTSWFNPSQFGVALSTMDALAFDGREHLYAFKGSVNATTQDSKT